MPAHLMTRPPHRLLPHRLIRRGPRHPGSPYPGRRGVGVLTLVLALTVGGLVQAGAGSADTTPDNPADPRTPVTVSADALPTAQIDGVAWQQVVIGNTVYVAGKFSQARPPGAAPGTQTVTRNNLMAYDLRTGALIAGFAPNLNAQALTVAASPDGSRLYVGGDFTAVNGQTVWRAAALNPSTGALITAFLPRMGASVRAITATNSTVYLGGLFSNVGSVARGRLAAVRASDGGLLSWAPQANARVNALVLSPGADQVAVGGAFTTLNGSGQPGYGLGRVDAINGTNLPFAANQTVRNGGNQSAVLSLSTDGTHVYGTGYIFGTGGNLEGAFSATWSDGKIRWVEDCHGDSYGVWASSTAVYVVGHPHYCANIGAFPETSPRSYHRALAFSRAATGVMTHDTQGYPSFTGAPSPSLQTWFPDLDTGTATGQNQGPWAVTGNSEYVALAGEFRTVNGTAQQGLVRFAVSSLATNKQGPRGAVAVTATYTQPGTVALSWPSYWDRDTTRLQYSVIRDGNTATPVGSVSQLSTFWQRPTLSFTDTGLSAGSHNYRVTARDPAGNSSTTATVTVNVPVGGAGNNPPVAAFTAAATGLQANFDASGSSDPGGSIAAYAWAFGDGGTGSGRLASHSYAAAGSYQAVLTVTDNQGATASTTQTVVVGGGGPPVGAVLAQDTFARTLTSGLGTATTGGPWTLSAAASAYAVSGGVGSWKLGAPGFGPAAYLRGVSAPDTELSAIVSVDKVPTGGAVHASLAGRGVTGTGDYRLKVRFDPAGTVGVSLTRTLGSAEAVLTQTTLAGVRYQAGTRLAVRVQTTDTAPTSLRARVWVAGTAEPTGWQLTASDTAGGLQTAGGVGVLGYVSSSATNTPVVLRVESFLVTVP